MFDKLVEESSKRWFPGLKIIDKNESILMKFINWVLNLAGQVPRNNFLDSFWTTLAIWAYRIYYCTQFATRGLKESYPTLIHELIHCYQRKMNGVIKFNARYVFSRSWRCALEYEAYCASMYILNDTNSLPTNYVDRLVELFAGPVYLYMEPDREKIRELLSLALEQIKWGIHPIKYHPVIKLYEEIKNE